jgi:hypothetical protein
MYATYTITLRNTKTSATTKGIIKQILALKLYADGYYTEVFS